MVRVLFQNEEEASCPIDVFSLFCEYLPVKIHFPEK
jgi:hypothetical protein